MCEFLFRINGTQQNIHLENRSLSPIRLRTLIRLSGYGGTVCWRQEGTEDEVSAFHREGCSCLLRGPIDSKPWRTDHFSNSSIHSHRSFQNLGSPELIKSMKLLMANLQVYSGRHFFPGTESSCPPPRAARPRIRMPGGQQRMNTNAEQRAHWCRRQIRRGTALPPPGALQHHQARCSPHTHTARLGTATLTFLGFSFHVAHAEHCPLCPPPTHLYRVFLLAMYNSID